MLRSILKIRANKTTMPTNIAAYKKQGNYVNYLNKWSKHYFDCLETKKGTKPFWNVCKPNFSNKQVEETHLFSKRWN